MDHTKNAPAPIGAAERGDLINKAIYYFSFFPMFFLVVLSAPIFFSLAVGAICFATASMIVVTRTFLKARKGEQK